MNKVSEMLCMKVYKVRLLQKHSINYLRNCLGLLSRRRSERKLMQQKMRGDKDKLKRLVEGMLNKLLELENNACMSRL